MNLGKGYLHCKKSELPLAVVIEDDKTGNYVVQELHPGKRKPGSCIRDARKDIVSRVRSSMK